MDNPLKDDNRNYDYTSEKESARAEYPVILDMVKPGSRVIDLGCGNGSLLQLLAKESGCSGMGMDISESGVKAVREKGLQGERGAIDRPLIGIRDQSFDYAICNVTVQMVMYPEVLLAEMKRIARFQIVSFPNFAHYLNRWDLLVRGRMPRPLLFGYDWFSTAHIHQLSIRDFEQFCAARRFTIMRREWLPRPRSCLKRALLNHSPNLFALEAIYLLTASEKIELLQVGSGG